MQSFWGGAWYLLGETFPFPANRCLATAGPCPVPQRCLWSRPCPSTTCTAALEEAGEIAQGSAPWGWLCAGPWELPRVLVRGVVRQVCAWSVSLWEMPPRQHSLGLGSPAQERFGCAGRVVLLAWAVTKAQHRVGMSGWRFRRGQDACDILGTPAGLG